MMKDKRGFSLIEILGVIAIIGVVVGIAIVSFNAIKKSVLKSESDSLESLIELKAIEYANQVGVETITVKDLVLNGFLEYNEKDNVIDPYSKESLLCNVVIISFEDGKYFAKLGEKSVDKNGECSVDTKSDLTIKMTSKSGKVIKSGEWNKESIVLTPYLKVSIPSNTNVTYKWSNAQGFISNDKVVNVDSNTMLNTTYKLEISYLDNDNNLSVLKSSVDVKIDKVAPTIISLDVNNANVWTSSDKIINIHASDASGSGINGIYVSENSDCSGSTKFIKGTTVSTSKGMGKYYVCALDNVGNKGSIKEVVVNNIDKTEPVLYKINGNEGNTSISISSLPASTLVKAEFKDDESGIKNIKYYLSTSSSVPDKDSNGWKDHSALSITNSCSSSRYYLFSKATNNAGFTSVKQIATYYDRCSSSGSSSSGRKPSSGSSSSGRKPSSGSSCDTKCQMQKNSAAWGSASASEKERLHKENEELAKKSGENIKFDSGSGYWKKEDGSNYYESSSNHKK